MHEREAQGEEDMGTRKPFWLWVWVMCALVVAGMVPACLPGMEQAEPIIVLDPITGGPGTSVAVTGSGFPAETQVSVRLGPPSIGATPQSYGDATTDAYGRFALSFTMPAHWPDGTPITETDLVVVVLNEDGSVKASAPFGYIPSPSEVSGPISSPVEAHRQVILAWHREGGSAGFCGDVVVYESGYVEITSCQEAVPLERRLLSENATERLHAWKEAYQTFEVEQTKGTGENRVTTRIAFVGNGSREVTEIEVQMIQVLLETLVSSQ
jgi:hypothetical protein